MLFTFLCVHSCVLCYSYLCVMFAYSYSPYLLASTVGSQRWQDCPWPVTGDYSWSSLINQYLGEREIFLCPSGYWVQCEIEQRRINDFWSASLINFLYLLPSIKSSQTPRLNLDLNLVLLRFCWSQSDQEILHQLLIILFPPWANTWLAVVIGNVSLSQNSLRTFLSHLVRWVSSQKDLMIYFDVENAFETNFAWCSSAIHALGLPHPRQPQHGDIFLIHNTIKIQQDSFKIQSSLAAIHFH